jgi:CheY-like chemotaxis protein
VLVVEDEPTVLTLAASIVEDDLGCKALLAASAREALALLEADPAVTVLFTDIQLPDDTGPAIDGYALAQRARELRPDLRVIYTSGGGQTDGATALSVEGAIFLPKPYTRKRLVEALRSQEPPKN